MIYEKHLIEMADEIKCDICLSTFSSNDEKEKHLENMNTEVVKYKEIDPRIDEVENYVHLMVHLVKFRVSQTSQPEPQTSQSEPQSSLSESQKPFRSESQKLFRPEFQKPFQPESQKSFQPESRKSLEKIPRKSVNMSALQTGGKKETQQGKERSRIDPNAKPFVPQKPRNTTFGDFMYGNNDGTGKFEKQQRGGQSMHDWYNIDEMSKRIAVLEEQINTTSDGQNNRKPNKQSLYDIYSIDSMSKQIMKLEEKNKSLEEQNKTLEEQNKSFEKRIGILEEQINTLLQQNQSLTSENQEIKKSIGDLHNRNNKLEQLIEDIQNKIYNSSESLNDLVTDITKQVMKQLGMLLINETK